MALLSPVRLRFIHLPLTPVDESLDPDDLHLADWDVNKRPDILPLRHEYLRTLSLGQHWVGKGRVGGRHRRAEDHWSRASVLPVSPRETVLEPGRTVSRRSHQRSWSEPWVRGGRMAAVVEEGSNVVEITAPSSPPELSYSKSSKSSSSSDTESSDDNVSTKKLDRSEESSVDGRDSIEDSNLRPERRPTLRRPPPRSLTLGEPGPKTVSPPLTKKEFKYPSLSTAVNGVLRDQSLNLPHGRGMRRGFTSPSSPSHMMHSSNRVSSRSPSPGRPLVPNTGLGMTISPQMLSSSTSKLSGELRSPSAVNNNGAFARRKSWQPGRKSVKELEAECDNLDEEVPDEAVLENVPISPMPGQTRLSPRTSRSATPSPHRRPSPSSLRSVPSHSNLHSANVPKKAKRPSAPSVLPNGQYRSPRSPRNGRPPMLQHSNTMPAFIGDALSRRQRSKSWTEDLNDEARALSAALEEFADRVSMEKTGSGANSVQNSPPRPDFAKLRSKSTIMDMPPISYGNIMIDPLPISKEKEAVLSKTRPSWLPPKNPQEEKKHIKEWECMMARAAENEKKRQLKERESQEDTDEIRDSIARMWEQHVLPSWDTVINEPRTRELWWRGVTPRSRGAVWQRAIGNELGLSESSYEAALNYANELEEEISQLSEQDRSQSNQAAWLDAIARDVPITCPELDEPEKRGPYQDSLCDVLKAYAMYRSDVGYVFGTHLIAGILCLHLRPADAFVALANLLNRPLALAFLVHDVQAMQRAYDLVLNTLKYKFTKLHDHLTSEALGLKPEEFIDPMFRCLFAYHLPVEQASRLWDVYVFEGDKALIRAAIAVLGRLESRLYGSKEQILSVIGWQNEQRLDLGSEEDFMKAVRDAGKVDGRPEDVKPVYV